MPVKTASFIKSSEVVPYALNLLPSLYVTSKKGWQKQWHYGKTELCQKITMAVRQGIVAVQRALCALMILLASRETINLWRLCTNLNLSCNVKTFHGRM
ncbi:late competence development ComFB family protein [Trichormus azollae]|uniref:late competence development ComFB family protein n=1 Tax=Trichormus azollae TaxID=1164 RepID=UPI00325D2E28